MMFLAAISGLAFVVAIIVPFGLLHTTLDVRVAVAGIYLLLGTVAHLGVAVLLRLDALLTKADRRG